jgi:VIT1/CCC1 family predicted Fe2+/Mn2+ transporter
MYTLSKREKEYLFDNGREIYTYKCMLSLAYELLAGKASDENTRQLLLTISLKEKNDADHWKTALDGINPEDKIKVPSFLTQRVRLMMLVLGSKSFLEWTLIAEDESLERMSIQAGNLQHKESADALVRIVADERLHVTRMKKEVLGMESWEMGESGGIRDVIFGANDGLVSILALVAGVYGAVSESYLILITGIAGAVAGTISMGAGAYLSAKSEKEVTQKENDRKGLLNGTPEQKHAELVHLYEQQGFSLREAEAVAQRVLEQLEFEAQQTLGAVTGLSTEDDWPPSKAGILTGISFLVASIVPILPFAFLEATPAAVTAMIASIAALFSVGASKAIFTRSSWVRSGAENMMIGTLAAAATYIIGILIPGI